MKNTLLRLVYTKLRLQSTVGPGLAQLVERLAHRYSESTSLNTGNFTSATVCGNRTGCVPAAKRSASVVPEVDLGELYITFALHNANKAAHSGFETQRIDHQKSKIGVTVAPKKDMCPPKTFFKKKITVDWLQTGF